MYISHKSNVLQTVHETEWQCRRKVKGLSKLEYGEWLNTVTTTDLDGIKTVDLSGETGYTIVECTDENVQERLNQLGDYQSSSPDTGTVYNIKWSDSKVNCEEVLDIDGKSQSPKVHVKSHFKGDNTAKDARLLADKWVRVRRDRDNRLAGTDYLALSDNTISGDMQIYRQKLRDVPAQADVDNITWPSKP